MVNITPHGQDTSSIAQSIHYTCNATSELFRDNLMSNFGASKAQYGYWGMWKVGWPYLAGPWHMTQNGTQATHWSLSTTWFQDHNNLSHLLLVLSVGKTLKVTPGTPDVKSRHTRCQKKLWLQLICCTPFRLLFQDFRMEVGGRIRDVLGVRRRSKAELIQYLN